MSIIELRQYTHHPKMRETLIEMFESVFADAQRDVGMDVIASFRDLDDADRFVWLRGFPDAEQRGKSLDAFYSGPIWQARRTEANATLIDTDNVLQLREAAPGSGFQPTSGLGGGVVVGAVHERAVERQFASEIVPRLEAAGVRLLARYVTDPSPNSYPRLPVREGEDVFVWFGAAADAAVLRRLELPALKQRLVLAPTATSHVR